MHAHSLARYRFERGLGRGACGEVWCARDRISGQLVALKLLRVDSLDSDRLRQTLRKEAGLVASLDHPNVVRVLDFGEEEQSPHDSGRPAARAGAPWIAMEFLAGGSLSALAGKMNWSRLRWMLLTLLDALAHTHARGVIHRDLKPANVLLDGATGGAKITDFGLSLALEAAGGKRGQICGTPGFMAPEQILDRPADRGPWTDLYALGITAWTLAAGKTPLYEIRKEPRKVLRTQIDEPTPPLPEGLALPRGFGGWIERLTEREPWRRFSHASEAARALLLLGDDELLTATGDPGEIAWHSTLDVELDPPGEGLGLGTLSRVVAETISPGTAASILDANTVPPWRELSQRRPATGGLGLLGLRRVRIVGRDGERDRLWGDLSEAVEDRSPRLSVLHGPRGSGVSRLARWVAERAHELGVAETLIVGEGEQLVETLCRRLGVVGLPRLDGGRRLMRLASASGQDAAVVRRALPLLLPEPEIAAVAAGLDLLRRGRPLVIVLDEAHEDAADLRALLELLSGPARTTPLLALVAVQSPALARLPAARRALFRLQRLGLGSSIRVDRLTPRAAMRLARLELGLRPTDAAALVQATERRPGAALDLVVRWVREGALRASTDGLTVAPHAVDPDLPPRLARLRAVLDGSEQDHSAVVVAALMGPTISQELWTAACNVARVQPSERLVARLVQNDVVRLEPTRALRWSFCSGGLQDAFLSGVSPTLRRRLHRACASALTARTNPDPQRIGFHLLRSGEPREAVEPLLAGMLAAVARGDLDAGAEAEARCLEAVECANIPEGDPVHARVLLARAGLAERRGEVDTALGLAHFAALAAKTGSPEARVEVTLGRAAVLQEVGRATDAERLLRELRDDLPPRSSSQMRAQTAGQLGQLLASQGRFEEAEPLINECRRLEPAPAPSALHGRVLREFSSIQVHQGKHHRGEATLERALAVFRTLRDHRERWRTLLRQARHARDDDDVRRAESICRAVLREARVAESPVAGEALVALAVLAVCRGQEHAARTLAVEATHALGERSRPVLELLCRTSVAAGLAAVGSWPAYDRTWSTLAELDRKNEETSVDLARARRGLAELLERMGRPHRAKAVRLLGTRPPAVEAG